MRTAPGEASSWEDALAYANGRNSSGLCGYNSGWRLPNVLELESLVNIGRSASAPWLTENGFAGLTSERYWSSTTVSSATGYAWVIDFGATGLGASGRDVADKTLSRLVLPVRGITSAPAQLWKTGQTEMYGAGDDGDLEAGVAWPTPRFESQGNGTARDNLTGLIWTTGANTPGPKACDPGTGKIVSDAYPYIQCLNNNRYLGYSDWRMPNRKEMGSLVDHGQSDPALPQGHPFSGVVSGYYWTSDTNVALFSSGWAFDMNIGLASVFYKNYETNTLPLWPVRGPLSLKVLFGGDGEGIVTGNQISCSGGRCLGVLNDGQVVTLAAEASDGSVFVGWTGCASPSGNECTVTMDGADVVVTATFLKVRSIWEKPSTVNFGKVGVGVPSSQYIAVENRYATDLHLGAVSITGSDASEFAAVENCSGAGLLPGESCGIILTVNAQGYGTRAAELAIAFSGAVDSEATMKLKAKAMPAKVVVDPKTMNFGKVSTTGSAEQQITIENKGPTNLNILSVTKTGDLAGDFTVDSSGCSVIQQNQTCSFSVTFHPGGTGKRTGVLAIASDAPKKSTVNVKLKGEGT